MSRKKAPKFQEEPPVASDLNEANALIEELWEQLRHLTDKQATNSKNSRYKWSMKIGHGFRVYPI